MRLCKKIWFNGSFREHYEQQRRSNACLLADASSCCQLAHHYHSVKDFLIYGFYFLFFCVTCPILRSVKLSKQSRYDYQKKIMTSSPLHLVISLVFFFWVKWWKSKRRIFATYPNRKRGRRFRARVIIASGPVVYQVVCVCHVSDLVRNAKWRHGDNDHG